MATEPRPGERVYQEIKQAILSGEFALQQRLDIDSLAERFGVSATPVARAHECFAELSRGVLVRA
jgi:DNA-binding GntR family transcriptional regulator